MHPAQDARVILRHADRYDPKLIQGVIGEGLDELGLAPFGRTLVKPNLVIAGPRFDPAWTRVEFAEGVLAALRERASGRVRELAVGERCAITIPTRFVYEESGYSEMLERLEVKRYCFDEVTQVEVPYTHARRLRDYVFVPEPVASADFFVNIPKFKSHPWTTVTFSMKNYIGLQDDRHRMVDHDQALSRKVADLQHVIQPQFIAIDAIVAGEGSTMLAPTPRQLNLIVMGNNQVAVDSVCSRILGLDPRAIDHIRFAHEDGFGPVELDRIALSGDVSLAEARERAHGFRVGLVRVDKFFEGTRVSAYAGPAPGQSADQTCSGGCPGALEEAMEVLRRFDAQAELHMPRLHFVFGDYRGPIEAAYGEKVIFVGDCATFEGTVGDQLVKLESLYRERRAVEPRHAVHQDIFKKMLTTLGEIRAAKHRPYLRLEGCPVSVADLMLILAELGKLPNPYLTSNLALPFAKHYASWRAGTLQRRLTGHAYQHAGTPAPRGAAAPVLPAS